MFTACVDGWNLALPHGSGIATYGHTLLEMIQRIGAKPQVLYGPSEIGKQSAILDEIAIIASSNKGRKGGKARALSTMTARFGRHARPLLPNPEIIWPTNSMRQPVADNYWVAHELYHLAIRAFRQYGSVTPIRFDSGQSGISVPDVVHWTCPLPVYAPDSVNILTVHDLIPLKLPHTTKDHKASYLTQLLTACDRADHILAVSEHTKRDLLAMTPIKEDKVTVTYQPVLKSAVPFDGTDKDEAWLKQNLGLARDGYFLFYGAIEPKKNLGRIVEAYLESGSRTPLVIVGGRSWLDEHETGLLNGVIENGNSPILRLDYLPRSALERLIRCARATLFPSLYEGFGLPALESLAVGTPVLASTGHALEEIVGDAALLVDPYDPHAIRNAISTLDNDKDLRAHLRQAGLIRARTFSTANYQNRMEAVYQRLGLL